MHDRGLVTLIRQHHDAIDALVAEAYGWGEPHAVGKLDDAEILTRLVALNKVRAAEEAKGKVRWLRPAFQAPGAAPEVSERLDLGEPVSVPASAVIKSLPEQVSAVAGLLASVAVPLSPQDVAHAFAAKRATPSPPSSIRSPRSPWRASWPTGGMPLEAEATSCAPARPCPMRDAIGAGA